MNHRSAQMDGALTIRLSGHFTFEDHGVFRDLLKEISSSGCKQCALDICELKSIDSAGLGMLMIAYDTSVQEHWNFVITRPRGQVKRLLEITDFAKIISIKG